MSPPIDSLIPTVYSLLDFLLRYKNHSKWLFDVCRRVLWRVIRITRLWACVVFAWIARLLIFYSISGTKVPVCVGEKSINQLILASTHIKTFLLVGKRFYIFFNCPRNKRKSVLKLNLIILFLCYFCNYQLKFPVLLNPSANKVAPFKHI